MKTLLSLIVLVLLVSCNGGGSTAPATLSVTSGATEEVVEEVVELATKHLVFVPNSNSETITVSLIEDGNITEASTVASFNIPLTAKASQDGNCLYTSYIDADVTISGITVWEINTASRSLVHISNVASTQLFQNVIEISTTGSMLFTSNSGSNSVSTYSVNQETCAITFVNSYAVGTLPQDVKQIGNYLYVVNSNSSNISVFSIADNATLTPVETKAVSGVRPFRIGVDRVLNRIFVPNKDTDNVEVFTIAGNGTLTSTDLEASGDYTRAAVYNEEFLYVVNSLDDSLYVYAVNADNTLSGVQQINNVCAFSGTSVSPNSINKISDRIVVTCEGTAGNDNDSSIEYFTIEEDGTLDNQASVYSGEAPFSTESISFQE